MLMLSLLTQTLVVEGIAVVAAWPAVGNTKSLYAVVDLNEYGPNSRDSQV